MKEKLIDAINGRQIVEIEYEGDSNLTGSPRKVEALVLGINTAGAPVLRAYQTSGKSNTSGGEAWRLFRVDKIKRVTPTGETFSTSRPGYNQNGDAGMSTIEAQVKF